MIYLIDGHNLIAKLPHISLDDPNDEVKLVIVLRSWAAASRSRGIIVIFDKGLPGGKAKNLSSGNVMAIFAPVGKTADALLMDRIRRAKNPADYTLVSSDEAILQVAQSQRMPIMRAEAFVKELQGGKRKGQKTAILADVEPGEAEEPHISSSEVDEWLTLFGPVRERPKPRLPPLPAPEAKSPPAAKPKQPRSLDQLKRSEEGLDSDEVEEWLRLFGDEQKKKRKR